jgi:hypothetical protein
MNRTENNKEKKTELLSKRLFIFSSFYLLFFRGFRKFYKWLFRLVAFFKKSNFFLRFNPPSPPPESEFAMFTVYLPFLSLHNRKNSLFGQTKEVSTLLSICWEGLQPFRLMACFDGSLHILYNYKIFFPPQYRPQRIASISMNRRRTPLFFKLIGPLGPVLWKFEIGKILGTIVQSAMGKLWGNKIFNR